MRVGQVCFRLLSLFVLGLSLFLGSPLSAQTSCLTVKGEVLYFAPSFDTTYFVINGSGIDGAGNPTPSGKRINNPIDPDLGLRLEGIYGFDCSCFACGFRWTYLPASSRKTVSNQDVPPQLWPTEVIPNLPNVPSPFSGRATSRINVMYQKAEVLFQESLWQCGCCCFTLREAVEWSYIRYHEKVRYQAMASSETVQYHAHTKGLGPQIGVIAFVDPWRVCLCLPRNLSLKVMTTASLIVANSKAKVKMTDALAASHKVTQSSFWKLLPEWSLDIALHYLYYFCSRPLSFEIGYEFTNYFRGTSKLTFTEAVAPGLSFNQYSDFYVHGVHFSLGLHF